MARKTLKDVLAPLPENAKDLRWETVVPIGTNAFILVELFQFAFTGAAGVVLALAAGVWFTEKGISMPEAFAALSVAAMTLTAVMVLFVVLAFLFFGNRYFAVYRLDAAGVYYEGSRGRDEGTMRLCLAVKPFHVTGTITAWRTRARHVPWDRVDSYQSIPSMRAIMLRRGRWHIVRLYTPDAATHARVEGYLAERLRNIDN